MLKKKKKTLDASLYPDLHQKLFLYPQASTKFQENGISSFNILNIIYIKY